MTSEVQGVLLNQTFVEYVKCVCFSTHIFTCFSALLLVCSPVSVILAYASPSSEHIVSSNVRFCPGSSACTSHISGIMISIRFSNQWYISKPHTKLSLSVCVLVHGVLMCTVIHVCVPVHGVLMWCTVIHVCVPVHGVLMWCTVIHVCVPVHGVLMWCTVIHVCVPVHGVLMWCTVIYFARRAFNNRQYVWRVATLLICHIYVNMSKLS